MVRLTKINGSEIWVNADLVETLEETPDTIVGLTTGKKIVVTERVTEVVQKILEYQRLVRQPPHVREMLPGHEGERGV